MQQFLQASPTRSALAFLPVRPAILGLAREGNSQQRGEASCETPQHVEQGTPQQATMNDNVAASPVVVTPSRQPNINLFFERVDRTALQVSVPVDRQIFAFFPTLHGPHLSIQVEGNLLPRVEAFSVRPKR